VLCDLSSKGVAVNRAVGPKWEEVQTALSVEAENEDSQLELWSVGRFSATSNRSTSKSAAHVPSVAAATSEQYCLHSGAAVNLAQRH
jgi:hypothetical protein